MVAQYSKGGESRRNACSELLNQIESALRSVTVTAPDYETLQACEFHTKSIAFDVLLTMLKKKIFLFIFSLLLPLLLNW